MPVQPLNGLSGFAPRTSPKRTAAPCGFFVPEGCTHLSMVGRAGEPKGSPGSLVTGSANPVRLTTIQRFAPLGGDSKNTKGVQP
ncbi:ash family protein [Serratia marcescens]|uniref:ash family protein n=1 Tax=Serratia marcescens TaxID=615 RepID=UPI003CAA5CA1